MGKEGNAYIDDFEGSQSAIDIRSWTQWSLASTPKLQPDLFPEGDVEDSLLFNFNRARLNWYTIDPSFFGGGLPDGEVDVEVRSNHLMRLVENKEVFPNRQLPLGTPENLPTLDLTFDPTVRGPYNYLPAEGIGPIPGLNADGTLQAPEERWGGIQRALLTTDFELSNVEYIQFWVMDPFNEDSDNDTGGDLYLQPRLYQRGPSQRWPIGLRERPALRQPACAWSSRPGVRWPIRPRSTWSMPLTTRPATTAFRTWASMA